MNKFIISFLLIFFSTNANCSFREVWGRYFVGNNIKGGLDLISNIDVTLDTRNPNFSYYTLRSLLFFQVGRGWFFDLGPAYRGDFASNINYREFRLIASVHNISNVELWNFRNRVRFEKRWIKEGPTDEMIKRDPLRIRYRSLFQKSELLNLDKKIYAYAGPEFFFEQNVNRSNKIDLGSIRWIFSIGRIFTKTISAEIDYWHRQYVNQEAPNFGSLLLRFEQVF